MPSVDSFLVGSDDIAGFRLLEHAGARGADLVKDEIHLLFARPCPGSDLRRLRQRWQVYVEGRMLEKTQLQRNGVRQAALYLHDAD